MNKRKDKNILWNIIGLTTNAFNSLFFLIIITRINGNADSGIFTYSFSVACLLYFIVNYCGRTFQVTDSKKEFNNKEYILNRIISFGLMLIIMLIFIIINKFNEYKTIIIILVVLYRCIDAVSEVFYGILQKEGMLYKTGISLATKSVGGIIVFLILDYLFKSLIISCVGIVLINLLMLIIYDYGSARTFIDKKEIIRIKNVLLIFKKTFFIFALSFLSIYLTNVTKYAMKITSNEYQNIFGIILMPATFVSLCSSYLINPYLNDLTSSYAKRNMKQFKFIVFKLILIALIVSGIAIIGMWFFGPMILNILYGLHFKKYRIQLEIIIVGALFYSIMVILSNVLTSIRKTFVQFVVYLLTSIIGYFVCKVLIKKYLIMGASVSYLIVMFIGCFLYFIYYIILIRKEEKNE